jgi:hypothetical protein
MESAGSLQLVTEKIRRIKVYFETLSGGGDPTVMQLYATLVELEQSIKRNEEMIAKLELQMKSDLEKMAKAMMP